MDQPGSADFSHSLLENLMDKGLIRFSLVFRGLLYLGQKAGPDAEGYRHFGIPAFRASNPSRFAKLPVC